MLVTWLPEFQPNTASQGPGGVTQDNARIVQLTNGNFVVLWEDSTDAVGGIGNGVDIVGQLYDPLGNPLGANFLANPSHTADDERNFDVAALENGGFVVVYEDDPGSDTLITLRATEWTTTATGVGTSVTRTIAPATLNADIYRSPTVAAQADGDYLVAFEFFDDSQGENDVRAVRVSAAGSVGSAFDVMLGSSSATTALDVAVLTNGDYVVVSEFTSPLLGGIEAVQYRIIDDSSGFVTASQFVSDTSTNGDTDSAPSVVGLTSGEFVISWTHAYAYFGGIDAKTNLIRYAADGTAITGRVRTDNSSPDSHGPSSVFALNDGDYGVTFRDEFATFLGDPAVVVYVFEAEPAGEFRAVEGLIVDDAPSVGVLSAVGFGDGRIGLGWSAFADIRASILDVRSSENATAAYAPDGWQVGTVDYDWIIADPNADIVHGWDGADEITQAGGPASYYGDEGDDYIYVTSLIDFDSHHGGPGNDVINWTSSGVVNGVFDLVAETASSTSLTAFNQEVMTGFENLIGSNNADDIRGSDIANILDGGAGDDTIHAGAGDDRVLGSAGNDSLDAGTGHDVVLGDGGNDTILSRQGYDTVSGGAGDDVLRTAGGWDQVAGDDGDDIINADAGNDTVHGEAGRDTITGGGGLDYLDGGLQADLIRGGNGNDTILGGNGNDRLIGDFGADLIEGGNGDDDLRGENGLDTLIGGAGNDVLRGGNQLDTFVFADGFGEDRIIDFDALDNREKIDLSGVTLILDYNDLVANHMTQIGSYLLIDAGGGNTIRLDNVVLGDLGPGDFIF